MRMSPETSGIATRPATVERVQVPDHGWHVERVVQSTCGTHRVSPRLLDTCHLVMYCRHLVHLFRVADETF